MESVSEIVSADSCGKHASKGVQTGFSEAASELEKVVSQWDTQTIAVKLLRALCLLTAADGQEVQVGFTPAELIQAMREHKLKNPQIAHDNQPAMSKYIRDEWKKLLGIWGEKKVGVCERLNAQGIKMQPALDKAVGGGSGHQSRYFLKFELVSQSSSDIQLAPPEDGVQYFTEEIKTTWVTAALSKSGLLLLGWRANLVGGVLFFFWLAFIFILGLLPLSLSFNPSIELAISTAVTMGLWGIVGWWCIKPIYELGTNRITAAPFFLQPIHSNGRVIVIQRHDSDEANVVYLKQYSADCPLCNRKMEVVSGRREFRGRLVGRCIASPNEHVYSFDHILRIGTPLR